MLLKSLLPKLQKLRQLVQSMSPYMPITTTKKKQSSSSNLMSVLGCLLNWSNNSLNLHSRHKKLLILPSRRSLPYLTRKQWVMLELWELVSAQRSRNSHIMKWQLDILKLVSKAVKVLLAVEETDNSQISKMRS